MRLAETLKALLGKKELHVEEPQAEPLLTPPERHITPQLSPIVAPILRDSTKMMYPIVALTVAALVGGGFYASGHFIVSTVSSSRPTISSPVLTFGTSIVNGTPVNAKNAQVKAALDFRGPLQLGWNCRDNEPAYGLSQLRFFYRRKQRV